MRRSARRVGRAGEAPRPISVSGGTSVRHVSTAYAQRGWNAHPGGGARGDGGAPGSRRAARRPCPRGGGAPRAGRACRGGAGARTTSRVAPGLDDAPCVHHRRAVGDRGHHAEVVGDQQHREARLARSRSSSSDDPGLHGDVERGRRLVGDEQPRPADQGDRDRDALAHAAGELVGERGQRSPRGRGCGPRRASRWRARGPAALPQPQVEAQVLGERAADAHHRVKRGQRVLEDHRDLAPADLAQAASRSRAEHVAPAVDARPSTIARGGSRRSTASADIVLPLPLSPATPNDLALLARRSRRRRRR